MSTFSCMIVTSDWSKKHLLAASSMPILQNPVDKKWIRYDLRVHRTLLAEAKNKNLAIQEE